MMSNQKHKNWMLKTVISLAGLTLFGCGVKGDPLPPEKPPVIGRGQPSFMKATEEIRIPELPPIELNDKENKLDEEEQ